MYRVLVSNIRRCCGIAYGCIREARPSNTTGHARQADDAATICPIYGFADWLGSGVTRETSHNRGHLMVERQQQRHLRRQCTWQGQVCSGMTKPMLRSALIPADRNESRWPGLPSVDVIGMTIGFPPARIERLLRGGGRCWCCDLQNDPKLPLQSHRQSLNHTDGVI